MITCRRLKPGVRVFRRGLRIAALRIYIGRLYCSRPLNVTQGPRKAAQLRAASAHPSPYPLTNRRCLLAQKSTQHAERVGALALAQKKPLALASK